MTTLNPSRLRKETESDLVPPAFVEREGLRFMYKRKGRGHVQKEAGPMLPSRGWKRTGRELSQYPRPPGSPPPAKIYPKQQKQKKKKKKHKTLAEEGGGGCWHTLCPAGTVSPGWDRPGLGAGSLAPPPPPPPPSPLGHRRRALLLARDDLRLADLPVQRRPWDKWQHGCECGCLLPHLKPPGLAREGHCAPVQAKAGRGSSQPWAALGDEVRYRRQRGSAGLQGASQGRTQGLGLQESGG